MLITDYSNQDLLTSPRPGKSVDPGYSTGGGAGGGFPLLSELLTAGMIFILPIIFLLIISAK